MANSPYLRDLILSQTFLNVRALPSLWVSLHDGDPLESGEAEVAGASRQEVRFMAGDTGSVVNRDTIQYDDLPEAVVTHFGVWDAPTDGRFLTGGPLDMGLIVAKGKSLRWRAGDLTLRIP